MTKMNSTDKALRKKFLAFIAGEGGIVQTYRGLRVTVAVMPSICNTERARFAQVAVAHCAEADTFKRKRGELIAAERMVNAQFFSVPLEGRELWEVADSVAMFLGN